MEIGGGHAHTLGRQFPLPERLPCGEVTPGDRYRDEAEGVLGQGRPVPFSLDDDGGVVLGEKIAEHPLADVLVVRLEPDALDVVNAEQCAQQRCLPEREGQHGRRRVEVMRQAGSLYSQEREPKSRRHVAG